MIPKTDIPLLVEWLLSGQHHHFEWDEKAVSITDAMGLWYLGWPRKRDMRPFLTAALEAFNAREKSNDI